MKKKKENLQALLAPNVLFIIFHHPSLGYRRCMDSYSFFVQAIGFIPSAVSIFSMQLNSRRKILLLQLSAGLMWVTHYYLLGAYTAVFTNLIGILRSTVSYFNDRKWAESILWLYLIIALSLLATVLTWDGWISLLPAVSLICTATGFWVHNLRITRALMLLQSPCLLLYDIKTGSWGCAVIEAVAFVSFILAILRFDLLPLWKERKEKKEHR